MSHRMILVISYIQCLFFRRKAYLGILKQIAPRKDSAQIQELASLILFLQTLEVESVLGSEFSDFQLRP